VRPFVFVNIASSIDGKISNEKRIRLRISCDEDLKRVDKLRAESDAIMVGIGTVLADDPRLTVKSEELRARRLAEGKSENPIRVVVDSKCRIPVNARILSDEARTIVAVSKSADKNRIDQISKRAEVVIFGNDKVDLKALMRYLYEIGVQKLMVEGGGTLINSLLREKLVDEIYIYYAPIIIGGEKSPTICNGKSFENPIKLELVSIERLGEGLLMRWIVRYLSE